MYKKNKKRRLRRFHFMVKNSFSSVISQEEKKENGGSVEFQVVSFTNKIRRLTSHLELHKKDYLSQRGLRKILGKRQRLLSYLSKKNKMRYKELINQLDIRESKTQ
nr:ribosomal protein S15 [Cucumis sativus]